MVPDLLHLCELCLGLVLALEGDSKGSISGSLDFSQLENIHGMVDNDKDGYVTLEELHAFSAKTRHAADLKNSIALIRSVDSNNDGLISWEELYGPDDELDNLEKELEKNGTAAAQPLKENGTATFRSLTLEDLNHYKKAMAVQKKKFEAADSDGDGKLSAEELRTLKAPHHDDAVMKVYSDWMLSEKDLDGDGLLSQSELWTEDDNPGLVGHTDDAEFVQLDSDKDGKLTAEEYRRYNSGLHAAEKAFKALLQFADEDKDGRLELNELHGVQHHLGGHDADFHFVEWANHYDL